MDKRSDKPSDKIVSKTVRTDKRDIESLRQKESEYSRTLEISRDSFMREIPTKQHGLLYFIDSEEDKKLIELEEGEAIIGRSPQCDIQIEVENVSRQHARIIFRNEEYQIEDLGSTNGVYVNGIKVEKCVLRDHDQIDVGGVRILFSEEKIRQKK
jgi:pSer/pThr/pTyr-binding forkhead associated (FHA) protein